MSKNLATHPAVATIERMDRRGTLEVEHLLRLVRSPDRTMADELDDLAVRAQWPRGGRGAHGGLRVPLAIWAEVVSAYCRGGFATLRRSAVPRLGAGFVVAVAVEVGTEEAVRFLLSAYADALRNPRTDLRTAGDVASGFNLLLFKDRIDVAPRVAAQVRKALQALVEAAGTDTQRAIALCGLRWVGDPASLALIERTKLRDPVWKDTPATCARALRKRLRAAAAR